MATDMSYGAAQRAYFALGTQERHELDMHLAMMKRAEREQRQAEAAAKDCVFHPRVNQYQPSAADTAATSGEPVSVFERLREQARLREERQERREQERRQQEERDRQSSFKPAINKKTPFDENLKHLQQAPVEERLLFYGKAVAQSTQRRREEKERAEWEKTQGLHRNAQHADPQERRLAQKEFEERNARLLQRREVARRLMAEKASEELTFQPKISAISAAIDEAAKQERSSRLSAPRSANTTARAASARTRPVEFEDLFPSTSPRSRTRDAENPPHVDRGTLLYEQALLRQMEKQQEEMLREKHHGGHRPLTNPLSEDWIRHGEHQQLFQRDFVSRQALYEATKQEQREALARRQREAEEAERGTARHGPAVTQVELKEQVNRLYYQPLTAEAQPEHKRSQKKWQDAVSADCPFRPQLSSGTEQVLRRMGSKREPNVVKRLAAADSPAGGEGRAGSREALRSPSQHRAVQRELYEATPPDKRRSASTSPPQPKRWDASPAREAVQRAPSPAGPSPRRKIASEEMQRFYARQEQLLEAKEETVRLLKQKELVEEMAECTFRPKTTWETNLRGGRAADAARAPMEAKVSGLQQYLQRQAAAKRLKEEQEEKIRTMGLAKGSVARQRTSQGVTIVAPFHLETDKRGERAAGMTGLSSPWEETSLFALTTAERERVLATDYPDAYEVAGARDDSEDDDDEDGSSVSVFDIREAEPQPTEPRFHETVGPKRQSHSSSSGGEACHPRHTTSTTSSSRPDGHIGKGSSPRSALPSSSLLKSRAHATAHHDGNRSVSFVGLPDSSPRGQKGSAPRAHGDPYDMESLLSKLRDARH